MIATQQKSPPDLSIERGIRSQERCRARTIDKSLSEIELSKCALTRSQGGILSLAGVPAPLPDDEDAADRGHDGLYA